MDKKFTISAILGIILLGLIIGIAINQKNIANLNIDNNGKNEEQIEIPTKTEDSSGILPTPIFPPLQETVKRIEDTNIIIAGEGGEMLVPKDPSLVKIYKRKGDKLIQASFEDVVLDQRVTLKIISVGREAELIIEE